MSRQSSDNSKVHNEHRDEMLDRIQTAASISLSPELFEQLYLAPQNQVKGQLRQTLGNPTPLGEMDPFCVYRRSDMTKHWGVSCFARRPSPWLSWNGRVLAGLELAQMCTSRHEKYAPR